MPKCNQGTLDMQHNKSLNYLKVLILMISAEYFSIFFTVVVQSSAVWPAVSRPEVLTGYRIMLGIKDEVLHMLLISHFLLLFSFLILILIVAIFLSVRIQGSRREGGGWLAGVVRPPEPSSSSSYFSPAPARRRGLFSRN